MTVVRVAIGGNAFIWTLRKILLNASATIKCTYIKSQTFQVGITWFKIIFQTNIIIFTTENITNLTYINQLFTW